MFAEPVCFFERKVLNHKSMKNVKAEKVERKLFYPLGSPIWEHRDGTVYS